MESGVSSLNVQYTSQVSKKIKAWQDGRLVIKEGQTKGSLQTSLFGMGEQSTIEGLVDSPHLIHNGQISNGDFMALRTGNYSEISVYGGKFLLRLGDEGTTEGTIANKNLGNLAPPSNHGPKFHNARRMETNSPPYGEGTICAGANGTDEDVIQFIENLAVKIKKGG